MSPTASRTSQDEADAGVSGGPNGAQPTITTDAGTWHGPGDPMERMNILDRDVPMFTLLVLAMAPAILMLAGLWILG